MNFWPISTLPTPDDSDGTHQEGVFQSLAAEGDRARDARHWHEAYVMYRLALDQRPTHAGYQVQLGHAAKELGCFELAECAYRTACLLGASSDDTLEHLDHVTTQTTGISHASELSRLFEAVANSEEATLNLPRFEDLAILVGVFGASRAISVRNVAEWMRNGVSLWSVIRLLEQSGFRHVLPTMKTGLPSVGFLALRGMPRMPARDFVRQLVFGNRDTESGTRDHRTDAPPALSDATEPRWTSSLKRLLGARLLTSPQAVDASKPRATGRTQSPVVTLPTLGSGLIQHQKLMMDVSWTLEPKEMRRAEMTNNISRSRPILLTIAYSNSAMPASIGLNGDTRQLSLLWRRMTVFFQGAQEKAHTIELDFTDPVSARQFIAYGFSSTEPWGTWSVGGTSGLILCPPPWVSDSVVVEIDGQPFQEAFDDVALELRIAFGHAQAAMIGANTEHVSVTFSQQELGEYTASLNKLNKNNWTFLKDATPKISIIILNYNKSSLSLISAASCERAHISVPFEVIIADNGSSPDQFHILDTTETCARIHRISCNRFFGEGNNIAVDFVRGEYILFLNNDAFIQIGTVEHLLNAFNANADCGAAGPVFLYPDGRVQEAGAFIDVSGKAYQRGKFDAVDMNALEHFSECDYVSAACLMMKKKTFYQVGGFNYRFDPAYFEDVDICLRLHIVGQKTYVATQARCIHIENATTADSATSSGSQTAFGQNRENFLSVWSDYLSSRNVLALPSPDILADLDDGRVDVSAQPENMIFTPFPLVPGGGERYLLAVGNALSKLGPTALVSPDPYSSVRQANVLRDLSLPNLLLAPRDELRSLKHVACRGVLIGNEALPHQRLSAKRQAFICQFPFPADNLGVDEIAIRKRYLADTEITFVYSDFVKRQLLAAWSALAVTGSIQVVAPPVATAALLALTKTKERLLLTVGRLSARGHAKRQDVIIDAFGRARAALGLDWKLIVAGVVPNHPQDREDFARLTERARQIGGVEFVISPSAGELRMLYSRAAGYIHAAGFGATDTPWKQEHFGITVVEALAAGCDVVVYEDGGPKEILETVGAGRTYTSVDQLADLMRSIRPGAVSTATREKVRSLYDDAVFYAKIRKVLK